jgi:hypothetical protein
LPAPPAAAFYNIDFRAKDVSDEGNMAIQQKIKTVNRPDACPLYQGSATSKGQNEIG